MTMSESEPVYMGEAKCSPTPYGAATYTAAEYTAADIDPIIDWPPKITFKADNGKYLSRFYHRGVNNCEASKSPADEFCEFEVEVLGDHIIALKGDNGKYLSRVRRDGVDHTEFIKDQADAFCRFRYTSLGGSRVALKGDTGKFLSRVYRSDQNNIEVAKPAIDDFCKCTIGENLVQKEFTDIVYDLDTATINDEEALATIAANVPNTLDALITKTLLFKYMKSEFGTWNNTVGLTVGVESEFKTGIPFLAEGKVKVKAEVSATHSWGGSEGITQEVDDSTTVTVPAKTQLKVRVVVKRANRCEIHVHHQTHAN